MITELLGVAPRLALLATSRSPLHVLGEHEYPLGPLLLPSWLPPDQQQEGAVEALRAVRADGASRFPAARRERR